MVGTFLDHLKSLGFNGNLEECDISWAYEIFQPILDHIQTVVNEDNVISAHDAEDLAKIHKMDLNLIEFNPAFLTRQRQEELKLQFEIEQLEREIENVQDEMDLIDEEFEHFQNLENELKNSSIKYPPVDNHKSAFMDAVNSWNSPLPDQECSWLALIKEFMSIASPLMEDLLQICAAYQKKIQSLSCDEDLELLENHCISWPQNTKVLEEFMIFKEMTLQQQISSITLVNNYLKEICAQFLVIYTFLMVKKRKSIEFTESLQSSIDKIKQVISDSPALISPEIPTLTAHRNSSDWHEISDKITDFNHKASLYKIDFDIASLPSFELSNNLSIFSDSVKHIKELFNSFLQQVDPNLELYSRVFNMYIAEPKKIKYLQSKYNTQ